MTEVLETIATIAMWSLGTVFYGDLKWASYSEMMIEWPYDEDFA